MEDTSAKRTKIDDLLEYIENRLHELDEEKEELREYYEKDRERRCIEYTLHQRELTECAPNCLRSSKTSADATWTTQTFEEPSSTTEKSCLLVSKQNLLPRARP